jgi:hypothetical protein
VLLRRAGGGNIVLMHGLQRMNKIDQRREIVRAQDRDGVEEMAQKVKPDRS